MAQTEVKTLSATVVEESNSPPMTEVKTLSATVVEQVPADGGLAQTYTDVRPSYVVENGTPYVKFEPDTNNKQLLFYPETTGTYNIIALRPNLLDFFEAEQTFLEPNQVKVPHFNQLFLTDRNISVAEKSQVKSEMQSRAVGTGIALEFTDSPVAVPVPIVNPSAEDGITGWTRNGDRDRFTTTTEWGAVDGSRAFKGGDLSNGPERLYQDLDVSSQASSIDSSADEVFFNVRWSQYSHNSDDVGSVWVYFIDSGGSTIGSSTPSLVNLQNRAWVNTNRLLPVPTGTRTVRIQLMADSGSPYNDTGFDAVSAELKFITESENSVAGGLKDPYIPGVCGFAPA